MDEIVKTWHILDKAYFLKDKLIFRKTFPQLFSMYCQIPK